MRYILSGDPKVVADVLKENRIRVDRGWIEFTPYPQEAEEPTDDKLPTAEDTKDVIGVVDEKKPKSTKRKKSE